MGKERHEKWFNQTPNYTFAVFKNSFIKRRIPSAHNQFNYVWIIMFNLFYKFTKWMALLPKITITVNQEKMINLRLTESVMESWILFPTISLKASQVTTAPWCCAVRVSCRWLDVTWPPWSPSSTISVAPSLQFKYVLKQVYQGSKNHLCILL